MTNLLLPGPVPLKKWLQRDVRSQGIGVNNPDASGPGGAPSLAEANRRCPGEERDQGYPGSCSRVLTRGIVANVESGLRDHRGEAGERPLPIPYSAGATLPQLMVADLLGLTPATIPTRRPLLVPVHRSSVDCAGLDITTGISACRKTSS